MYQRRKCYNKFCNMIHELEPALFEDEDFRVPNDDGVFTEDDRSLNENEVLFKKFTESDHGYHDTNINFNDSWILLWIFKYQARFRLSDTAINSLIKFFRMVLIDADRS
jgi:hypothetical protein